MADAGNATDRTYLGRLDAKPQISTRAVLEEVSDGLKWVSERAFAFTAIFAAIAGWLWLDFLVVNKIPVSFFSSSLFAALPAFLGATVFVASIAAYMLLLPSFILNTPITPDGTSLIDLQRRSATPRTKPAPTKRSHALWPRTKRFLSKKRTWGVSFVRCSRAVKTLSTRLRKLFHRTATWIDQRRRKATPHDIFLWLIKNAYKCMIMPLKLIKRLLTVRRFRRHALKRLFNTLLWAPRWLWQLPAGAGLRWLVTTVIIGLSWMFSVPLLTIYQVKSVSLYSLGLAVLSAVVGSLYLCRGVKNARWGFRALALLALTIQSYVAILILDIAVHQIPSTTYWGYLKASAVTTVVLYFVVIIQLIWSTVRARLRFYKGIVRDCIIIATCGLTLITMVPSLAGRLAAYPIMVSSSGARPCSLLVLHSAKPEDIGKRIDPALLSKHNPTRILTSKPLSQIVQFDGMYY